MLITDANSESIGVSDAEGVPGMNCNINTKFFTDIDDVYGAGGAGGAVHVYSDENGKNAIKFSKPSGSSCASEILFDSNSKKANFIDVSSKFYPEVDRRCRFERHR